MPDARDSHPHQRLHTISEAAARSGLSAKTLRFYDAIGLVAPTATAPGSGYRLYGPAAIVRARRVGRLKAFGLSLPEIARVLDAAMPVGESDPAVGERTVLEAARGRLVRLLADKRQELAAVQARLVWLAAGGAARVVVRPQRARLVASVRDRLADPADAEELTRELAAGVGAAAAPLVAGPLAPTGRARAGEANALWTASRICGALWHACGHGSEPLDAEPFVEVVAGTRAGGRVRIWELPAVAAACAEVWDADDDAEAEGAYDVLRAWLNGHGRTLAGPKREVYRPYRPKRAGGVGRLSVQFPLIPA